MGKFILIVFAACFAYAAVVQYNDPDAWLWLPLYGIACAACAAILLKRRQGALLCWAAIGASLVMLIPTVGGVTLTEA